MKSIFNISKMFETPLYEQQLLVGTDNGSFMNKVIINLEDCNKEYINLTKDLYTSLNEADDIKEENDIFTKYHLEVCDLIDKNIKSITELASMFSIRLENMATNTIANLDKIEPTSLKSFAYRYREFNREEILSTKYPNLNMRSIYRDEFEFLGGLLKELGIYAKDKDKLSVIATVYNTFSSKMKTQGKENCIEHLTGRSVDYDKSLPTIIFSKFRDDDYEDINIGSEELYDAKYSLKTCSEAIDVVNNIANAMISDLNYIRDDIKESLFNMDKKTLKLKGGNVKLDEFSINQLQMFYKVKVNQLMQMFNLFNIAFSIKLDAITEYYEQMKDIIDMAMFGSIDEKIDGATSDDNDAEVEEPEDSEGEEPDGDAEGEEPDDEPELDDEGEEPEGTDDNPDNDGDDDDFTMDEDEEPEGTDDNPDPDGDDDDFTMDEDEEPVNDDEEDIKEMVKEFNYDLYELQMMQENMDLMEHILFLNEEDAPAEKKEEAKETKSKNKKNIFQRIIEFFKNLIQKFQNKVDELRKDHAENLLVSDKWKKIFKNPSTDILKDRTFSVIPVMDTKFLETVQNEYEIANTSANMISDLKDEKITDVESYLNKRFPSINKKKSELKDASSGTEVIIKGSFDVKEKTGGGFTFNDLPERLQDVKLCYEVCLNSYKANDSLIKMGNDMIKSAESISKSTLGKVQNTSTTYKESEETLDDFFSVFLEEEDKPVVNYNDSGDDKTPTNDADNPPKDDTNKQSDDNDTKAEDENKAEDKFIMITNTLAKIMGGMLTASAKIYSEQIKFLKFYVSVVENSGNKTSDKEPKSEPATDDNKGDDAGKVTSM